MRLTATIQRLALAGLALCSLAAQAEIGTVQFSIGQVSIQTAGGQTLAAVKGSTFNEGDTLLVGPFSSAQLKMVDGGVLALRPETQMKFDQYNWSGREDGNERGLMSLLRGGFRTITGAIGRRNKSNYRVSTPTATVGIRGTDHEIVVIPVAAPGQPPVGAPAPGTYDKVNVGAATITSQGVTVVVNPNQVGHAPPQAAPRILPQMPNFMRATPPTRAGQPATQQAQQGQQGNQQGQQGNQQGQQGNQQAAAGGSDSGTAGGSTTTAGSGSSGGTGGSSGTGDSTVRTSSTVDNTSQMAAASSTAVQSGTSSPTTTTQVVSTTPTTSGPTSSGSSTTSASTTTVPVVLTGSNGTTANVTQQTVTTSSGTTSGISTSTAGVDAQAAATAAATAVTSLSSVVSANQALATQSLPSTTPATIAAAQAAFTTASALTLNTSGVAASVATAASSAASAQSLAATATTIYNANGAYADPGIATPAFNAMNTALSAVQSNNTLVANAGTTVSTQQTAYSSNISSGSAANTTIINTLNTANAGASTVTSTLTGSGFPATSTMSSLLATAQSAAAAAQSAATLATSFVAAGNTTQADAQLAIAKQQNTIAQNALNAAKAMVAPLTSVNAAVAQAGTSADTATSNTLYGFANSATAAANAANAAAPVTNAAIATPTPSAANQVQTQVAAVAVNAISAQYSNPVWANTVGSTPRGMGFVKGGRPVTGGLEQVNLSQKNTADYVSYVLDESKNLVRVRNSTDVAALGVGAAVSAQDTVSAFGANTTSVNQVNATAAITGATAGAEGVYIAPDKTVYMGRWAGGQVDVNGVSNVINMGTTGGLVWGLGLEPVLPGITRSSTGLLGENSYVHFAQQITGTLGFTPVYNTAPFDPSGRTGTLTSASLSANFTAQTVDASVGVSFTGARTSTFSGSVTGAPITQSGFESNTTNGFAPTITCTGTCASGYVGNISGGFTGTSTVTGAMLNYNFRSNETTGLFGDLVSGGVAFVAAGTPPTAGQNLSFPSNTALRHVVFYPVTATDSTIYSASIGNGSGVTSPNTNYLFDTSGNLVRIQETPYTLFDNAAAVTPANVAVNAITNNAANHPVEMSFSGTPIETYDASSVIGLRFGRYQGGKVTINDLANNQTYFDNLGNASALWAVGRIVGGTSLGSLTGQWHYTRIPSGGSDSFATLPADNWGNLGVLLGARLEVNFNTLTVNPGLRVGLGATGNGGTSGLVTLAAYAEDVSISGGTFNVSSSDANPLRVSCSGAGCGTGFGGRIVGNFTSLAANGSTADGALFRYTLANSSASEYVSGLVAFQKGPEVVAINTGRVVNTSYYYWNGTPRTFGSNEVFRGATYSGVKTAATFDGAGKLVSASEGGSSVTIDTTSAASSSVSATLSNGISFGRYDSASTATNVNATGLKLTGVDSSGSFTNRETIGVYHWISGPNMWPLFASMTVPGTATYTTIGNSSPTNQNGVAGTLTSASLSVNFNNQSVNTNLLMSVPGNTGTNTWEAIANNIALGKDGDFRAGSNGGTYAHNSMIVNINGSPIGFGSLEGQLTGVLMNGATLAYTLAGNPTSGHEHVNGVVAFGNPTFSANTTATPVDSLQPYLMKLTARGTVSGLDATTGATSTTSAASLNSDYLNRVSIISLDPSRTKFNGNALVEFDAESVAVTCGTPCSTSEFPTRIGINATASAASGALPAMPAITGTAATVVESGSDSATGIRWGRYSNGNFAIVDRVTGASVGTGNTTLGNINHYIVSSVQSGPVVLPTTGTFTYTLAGNTSPTDNLGNVGTLNSASLVANFAAQTVNVGVNATVNAKTFNASANSVPILASTGFEAATGTGGLLSVTCTTGCTGTTSGKIVGAFTGATGTGAAIAYSLNAGGLPGAGGTTIGGVAAFKR